MSIRTQKQYLIYNVADKVLVTMDILDKYSMTPYKGLYEIMKINDNRTIKIQMGAVLDIVKIRRVHPYTT